MTPPLTTQTPTPGPGLAGRALIGLVRIYQYTFAAVLGGRCRFHPSCSEYAVDALRTHGAIRGVALAARRFSRCHPLGGSGVDPVPPARPTDASTGV